MKKSDKYPSDHIGKKSNKGSKIRIVMALIVAISAFIINCGINLIITPLVTNTIGVEAYGYVTLAKNFTNYADIMMIALNAYAARFITLAYLRSDKKYLTSITVPYSSLTQ